MRDATVAVVPIRSLMSGKTRLSTVLVDLEREQLTRAMVEVVVAAILASDEIAKVIVVSPDQATLDDVQKIDDRIHPLLQSPPEGGLNAAVTQAFAEAGRLGASSTMVVFGDLPFLNPADIQHILRRDVPIVLGPDRLLQGTNVLMIRHGAVGDAADRFVFSYGPGSYQRHVDHAHELGLDVATVQMPGIEFDLDTPEDLTELRAKWDALALRREVEDPMACQIGGQWR